MIISEPCWHIKYANRPAIVIKNSWLIGVLKVNMPARCRNNHLSSL